MIVFLPLIPACVVSLKILFLVYYSSLCIGAYYPCQYPYFTSLLEPSPLWWRHTSFLFLLPTRSYLKHCLPSERSSDFFLDDC